ncbi:MAG: 3-oxoacyl-[acyl-carrier protein] reductase [Colwellia sp.]|jgi:3-oxoacyl-[acyl-carrier protein] reductase
MNSSLKNKWALVTGASRGVGQQIAIGLAQYGVNLVLHSSNIENQKSTVDLLKKYNINIVNVAGSLESSEEITQFVTDAELMSGGIDILYNNAAVMTSATPLFETLQCDYEKSFQVNLFSMIQICSYFAPKMKSRGFGRIINVSSGIKDTPILDAYSVSKAAVDKYTRDLAIELSDTGVLANMLDPGWCRTDLGGDSAFNDVTSVLPGALIPAMLGNEGAEAPKGLLFAAQDYTGLKLS